MTLRGLIRLLLARHGPDRPRSAVRQHDPDALDGRGPAGQLGSSRDPDGARADRARPLHARHGARAVAPRLARPRPLRALLRARLDAPLLGAAPHGLRGLARRHQELPPARLALRRPPGVRARAGDRDDDRAARPGHRHRGRPRARRAHAGGAPQPARPRDRRPPHLRDRLRRRPAGGRRVGGVLAGRPPRPRPPDLLLRRQPHLDRGRHGALVLRGRARALRGLRLARAEPRRGPRPRPHRGGGARGAGRRAPVADRRAHPHRARLAEQAGHPRRPRRAARRGGDQAHQAGLRLPEPRAVLHPRRGARALPRVRAARRAARGGVARALRGLPRRAPAGGGRARAHARARAARGLGRRGAPQGPRRRA